MEIGESHLTTLMGSPKNHGKKTWFVRDPCGIACAVATYIFLLYGEAVLLLVVAPPFPNIWTVLAFVIFTTLVVLSFICHLKAMLTEPVSSSYYLMGVAHQLLATPTKLNNFPNFFLFSLGYCSI